MKTGKTKERKEIVINCLSITKSSINYYYLVVHSRITVLYARYDENCETAVYRLIN